MNKLTVIREPLLEFHENKHVDIKFGLSKFGPFDKSYSQNKIIKVGIVGTSHTIDNMRKWLEKLNSKIPSKKDNKILHPPFPGLETNPELNTKISINSKYEKVLNPVELQKALNHNNHDIVAKDTATLFKKTIESLLAKTSVDLIICCPSEEVYKKLRIENPKNLKQETLAVDFHDLLKAKSLEFNIPTQLMWPWTYTESLSPPSKSSISLQSESTRAWNFYIATYYKTSGIPWRMTRDPEVPTTCYVGISFFHNIKKTKVSSSIAQVFNEKGEGIIMRGEPVKINKNDKQVNLSEKDAFKLLDNALTTYKDEHFNFPARVVLHKSSAFNENELKGFKRVLKKYYIEFYDFLSIRRSSTKLFREGYYVPLRGSFLQLDNKNMILYTRGSINLYQEYPGMYIPKPLHIQLFETQNSPLSLATEILELSKMNYNNSQFSESMPITLRTSRNVGAIIKYITKGGYLPPSYRFYM
ncbi:hypothetical protein [Gracilimonas sp.]|uniref:argonaute/piwi family protein n=1 Tax=Gracilimonas sp. TaxID=1974203 RepID=UPI0032EBAEF0